MYFDHQNEGISIPPTNPTPQEHHIPTQGNNAERFNSEDQLVQKYKEHLAQKTRRANDDTGILIKIKSAFSSFTSYFFSCCLECHNLQSSEALLYLLDPSFLIFLRKIMQIIWGLCLLLLIMFWVEIYFRPLISLHLTRNRFYWSIWKRIRKRLNC